MTRRRESRLGISFQAELIEALGQPGCGFCRLGQRAVTRFLEILGHENVNDVPIREAIRAALGLCNRHAWRFLDETRAVLGVAIISRDLLRTLQGRTAGAEPSELSARLAPLAPRGPCLACRDLETITRDSVSALLKGWTDPALRDAFAASDGLCWTHLVALLSESRSRAQRSEIIARQRVGWSRSRSDLDRLRESLYSAPGIWATEIDHLPLPLVGSGQLAATLEHSLGLPEGRCPVCVAVTDWLSPSYPQSPGDPASGAVPTSPESRGTASADAGGAGLLCSVHAWQPLGRQLTPRAVLQRVQDELGARLKTLIAVGEPPIPGWARRWLPPPALPAWLTADLGCPLCHEQLSREAALLAELPPSALCLPHLRLAAARPPDELAWRQHTRAVWHAVELLLAEFIRKRDYRFHHEPLTESEAAAPARATELLAGGRGVR